MTVLWKSAANADVRRIVAHIAEENPIAARRMAQELYLAASSLTVFPRRGRRGLIAGTRELAVVRPYVIVYEIDDANTVTILRIWHGAQLRVSYP